MKCFLVNILRWILAVVLVLPSLALVRALPRLPGMFADAHTAFLLGIAFGGGVVFFSMVHRFAPAYVLGHELTHWLAAKVFRRRTGRFRVRGSRGSVDVERPNIWIVLAPYFVPLYTLLWLGGCGVIGWLVGGSNPWLSRLAYAGVGFTYAFHVVLTFHCLRREQADLRRHGRLLSLSLILLCNVFILYVFAVAFSGRWGKGWQLPASHLAQQLRWCAALVRALWPG